MKVTQEINQDNRLTIEVREKFEKGRIKKGAALKLFFWTEKEDRLFPLEMTILEDETSTVTMIGRGSILLPYVFLEEVEGDVRLQVELYAEGKKAELGDAFYLAAGFFNQKDEVIRKKTSILQQAEAALLLPFFVLASLFFGQKGREALKSANKEIRNRTGVSFSLREIKTSYFRKQYERFTSSSLNEYPLKGNEVLFLSERRVEEGGNLSLIMAALGKEEGLCLQSFLVEKTVDKLTFSELKRAAYLISKAELIILEDFYPQLHALNLRKETKVIQLWHACGAFKTFGFSRLFKPGGPEEMSKNHRNYHSVFVSSEAVCPFYREAFALSKNKVLPLGVPRTDVFFNEAYKEAVRGKWKKEYPELSGKKIILFAPTFRGHGNKDAFYPESAFSVEAFMRAMPEDVILILKQHPFIKKSFSIPPDYKERVFDYSRQRAINDLLFVTDLLITDYSSSVFEAALLDLPMIFYMFDEEVYREERDIYGDFYGFMPGKKVNNSKHLVEEVKNWLRGEEPKYDYSLFKEIYLAALDGHSTERIARYIKDLIKEEGR